MVEYVVLSSDAPLIDPEMDSLGYHLLAKHLATSLLQMTPKEGLVVAINGEWGSGKSSLLNFITYYFDESLVKYKPRILRFTPWWFSNRDDLANLLLNQLMKTLSPIYNLGIIALLASFTNTISTIVIDKNIGVVLGLLSTIFSKISKFNKDIYTIKNRINNKLDRMKNNIIVIIDDIDRLHPDEICDLFRVIKSVANFHKIIYLLAFDRAIVINAFESRSIPGREYLEKIVQVSVDLPLAGRTELEVFLNQKLYNLFGDDLRGVDGKYLARMYKYSLGTLVRTPRNVLRLVNSISIIYPLCKNEVNIVDLIGLELVRIFYPSLFEKIRTGKGILTIGLKSLFGESREKRKKITDKWISLLGADEQEIAINILSCIFPLFAELYNRTDYTYDSKADYRKSCRVCHYEVFDSYFRLNYPPEYIPMIEIKNLIDYSSSVEDFSQLLETYSDLGTINGVSLVRSILDRMAAYIPDIEGDNLPNILNAFFQVGDDLVGDNNIPGWEIDFGITVQIELFLHQILLKIGQNVFSIVLDAIENGKALLTITDFVGFLKHLNSRQNEPGSTPTPNLLSDEEVAQCMEVILCKIRKASSDLDLLSVPHLWSVLNYWVEWGGNLNEVSIWVENILADDNNMLSFIEGFSSISTYFDGEGQHNRYTLKNLELYKYVDSNLIVNKLGSVAISQQSTIEQKTKAGIYLDLLKLSSDDNIS